MNLSTTSRRIILFVVWELLQGVTGGLYMAVLLWELLKVALTA